MIAFKKILILSIISTIILFAGCKAGEQKTDPNAPKGVGQIVLNWQTESEEDNYGYNIYRAESEEGPFAQINKEIIPGAGTTNVPTTYKYIDTKVEVGKKYFYYLESVSFAGVKEVFSPTISHVAKAVNEKEEKENKKDDDSKEDKE